MAELRRLRREQLENQQKEVDEGTRDKIIKISTVLPGSEPKNAASFRDEQLGRQKSGQPTPGSSASKSAFKPPKPPVKEFGATGSSGSKRASEGVTPPPKKSKGSVAMDPDSDLKAEVARLANLGELDRMVELASVHRKVCVRISGIFLGCSKF